jgi:hypothetical protein
MKLCREVIRREEISWETLLSDPALEKIPCQDNPPQQGEALLAWIRKRRQPAVQAAGELYEKYRNQVPIPAGIAFQASDFLENGTHRVSFTVRSSAELAEKAEALKNLSRHPGVEKLFRAGEG